VIYNSKIFQILLVDVYIFSIIATPPLKNISGGEYYLKEELEVMLSQSICYDHYRKKYAIELCS